MEVPTIMKAIKIVDGHKAEIQDVPMPKLSEDYLLCKVTYVALNPIDWRVSFLQNFRAQL